jgi:hypothetical protein
VHFLNEGEEDILTERKWHGSSRRGGLPAAALFGRER